MLLIQYYTNLMLFKKIKCNYIQISITIDLFSIGGARIFMLALIINIIIGIRDVSTVEIKGSDNKTRYMKGERKGMHSKM